MVGRNGVICSTDDFFVVKGRYIFEPDKLSLYHQKNQDKGILWKFQYILVYLCIFTARTAIANGKSPVIIDNTNSAAWQMKPYALMVSLPL